MVEVRVSGERVNLAAGVLLVAIPMDSSWLNRTYLMSLGFKDMDSNERLGFAGAGPDAMIMSYDCPDGGGFVMVADISFNEDYQGVELDLVIDLNDPKQDPTIMAEIPQILKMGKSGFSHLVQLLKDAEDMRPLSEITPSSTFSDVVQRLTADRASQRKLRDESLVCRMRTAGLRSV